MTVLLWLLVLVLLVPWFIWTPFEEIITSVAVAAMVIAVVILAAWRRSRRVAKKRSALWHSPAGFRITWFEKTFPELHRRSRMNWLTRGHYSGPLLVTQQGVEWRAGWFVRHLNRIDSISIPWDDVSFVRIPDPKAFDSGELQLVLRQGEVARFRCNAVTALRDVIGVYVRVESDPPP